MDAVKPIVDYLSVAPWWVIALLVAFMVLVGMLIWRAWGEGREISFWPPRIGPRPGAIDKSASTQATDISGRWNAYPRIRRTADL